MQTFNPSLFRWPVLCLLVWLAGCSPSPPVPASSPALAAPAQQVEGSAQPAVSAPTQQAAGSSPDVCPAGYVRIAPGTFTMGTPRGPYNRECDETKHSVTITRVFCMKATEVTQGEWQSVMGNNPSFFKDCGANCPVEQVNWDDAAGYANALSRREGLPECYAGSTFSGLTCAGYRLPTEAEWEYAARAGTTGPTYGDRDSVAWYDLNSGGATHPVGQKQPNAWGLDDMLGNVGEWTGDWYDTYPATVTDPTGPTTSYARVVRGGSWSSGDRDDQPRTRCGGMRCDEEVIPSAIAMERSRYFPQRSTETTELRARYLGFRLAMTVTRSCAALPPNATAGVKAGSAVGWGACEATACEASYHLESGVCVSNTRTCSPMPANATAGTQTWTGSAYGSCSVTTCLPDNTLVAGTCICSLGAACNGSLGAACTANAECASGFCATGPDGTANDRCAPTGMNYIPAGTFTMGSPLIELGHDTDEAQHSVTLSRGFFLGQTEVTQGQWKALSGPNLSGGPNPSYFQSTSGTAQSAANDNDNGPVENLDWYAAVAWANARSAAEGLTSCYTLTGCTDAADGWKDGLHEGCKGATFAGLTCTGYRLPTEAEWEYAARGGTTTATYRGDLVGKKKKDWREDCVTAQANLDGIAWWCRNSGSRTHAVGGKTANGFGLYDMLGNVEEWTGNVYEWRSDRNDTYPGTVTDPTGAATGTLRVVRGGSWRHSSGGARAANGEFKEAGWDFYYRPGFRLARTAP